MLRDICMLIVGAGLVCVGQLAHALVERLRYGKLTHPRAARAREREARVPEPRNAKDAIAALTGLGYTGTIAHAAVEAAIGKLGAESTAEALTRQALQECPKAHGARA